MSGRTRSLGIVIVCGLLVGLPGRIATADARAPVRDARVSATVVSVAPVITQTPTLNIDARFPGAVPPPSATRVDDQATFYIEVWASNVGAPLGGLACVHVDISYERTDQIDALPPRQNGHLFPIEITSPTFND